MPAFAAGGDPVSWVVHASPEVLINLIAAAIGGAMVWFASQVRGRVRSFRARKFWKSMGRRRPLIVLGTPDSASLLSWEKSGMVGKGDILALVAIEEQQRKLGFSGKIVEAKELRSADLTSDLILICGPEGNSVTSIMMDKLGDTISYEFTDDPKSGESAVRDRRSGRLWVPQYDAHGDPTNDFALIIRAANPLAPDNSDIVILAGCWGHGTAAAAEKLGDRKFLHRQRRSRHFEALVGTTVVGGAHYNTVVLESRDLPE
ncbi:hypothetical protein M8542_11295 [Amycolatopsis sp. OK19-0408]|uniref:Uncharacterized protein n=1 Tax=Amycolatopsis iheyensis TaxID=2945988 RepID=A0A9X2N7I6_9PSEU|nr:hypothetical protein [Amycolatopsis iheyensis]MCR6483404.1 hypothetical protein [Amycolatopsis iheyensis]